MGNRASVSFKKGKWVSATLNSHWDGKGLFAAARKCVKELKRNAHKYRGLPIGRGDPDTVMVEFVRQLTKDLPIVDGNYRLVPSPDDSDNSDQGHVTIELGGFWDA